MSDVYETAQGHEEPYSVQFSIFLANRIGKLKELLELLDDQQVPVVGLSIVDSADWAVVRVVSSQPGKARQVLRTNSIPFMESQVLLVELDAEDAMTRVCRLLVGAEVNIHFAYPLMTRPRDNPVLVVHVDDHVLAKHVLVRHGLTVIGHEDIGDEPR